MKGPHVGPRYQKEDKVGRSIIVVSSHVEVVEIVIRVGCARSGVKAVVVGTQGRIACRFSTKRVWEARWK